MGKRNERNMKKYFLKFIAERKQILESQVLGENDEYDEKESTILDRLLVTPDSSNAPFTFSLSLFSFSLFITISICFDQMVIFGTTIFWLISTCIFLHHIKIFFVVVM